VTFLAAKMGKKSKSMGSQQKIQVLPTKTGRKDEKTNCP
jgi:hypothetical protein